MCQLHCEHCNGVYLGGMLPAETPEALLSTCRKLRVAQAIGALLSGGSNNDGGILNLNVMLDAIRQVKRETGLILNLHPGLLDSATAQALAVDFASLEIPSEETIRNVFRLDAHIVNYLETYAYLQAAGINVIPHVCVYQGDEDRLLQGLASPPDVIVVIVFSPTRNTRMASAVIPTPQTVAGVIARIRVMYPQAELALGCMRPKMYKVREAMEVRALQAGVTRMALPSPKTLQYAVQNDYEIRAFDACCALPEVYEPLARRVAT